jgi:hypothetical protein
VAIEVIKTPMHPVELHKVLDALHPINSQSEKESECVSEGL